MNHYGVFTYRVLGGDDQISLTYFLYSGVTAKDNMHMVFTARYTVDSPSIPGGLFGKSLSGDTPAWLQTEDRRIREKSIFTT